MIVRSMDENANRVHVYSGICGSQCVVCTHSVLSLLLPPPQCVLTRYSPCCCPLSVYSLCTLPVAAPLSVYSFSTLPVAAPISVYSLSILPVSAPLSEHPGPGVVHNDVRDGYPHHVPPDGLGHLGICRTHHPTPLVSLQSLTLAD